MNLSYNCSQHGGKSEVCENIITVLPCNKDHPFCKTYIRQVVSCRSGPISQVVSYRGGLISQVVL